MTASFQESKFLLYQSDNKDVKIDVFLQNESVWLTQKMMSDLFGVDRSVITKHLSNIYEDNELDKNATSAKFALVQKEGGRNVSREIEFYNLDVLATSEEFSIVQKIDSDFENFTKEIMGENKKKE